MTMEASNQSDLSSDVHELLQFIFHKNYRGPVPDVLKHVDARPKRALDINSNSPWLAEMALEFPSVQWTGIEMRAGRHAEDSAIEYLVADFSKSLNFSDGSFDLVHARSTCSLVPNYLHFLKEVKRVLRPGGLFLWSDAEPGVFMRDRSDPSLSIPGCTKMNSIRRKVLAKKGIHLDIVPKVAHMLRDIGGFHSDISRSVICVPIGEWDNSNSHQQNIGRRSRKTLERQLAGLVPVLKDEFGMTEKDLYQLTKMVHEELHDTNVHTFQRYHTAFALRR